MDVEGQALEQALRGVGTHCGGLGTIRNLSRDVPVKFKRGGLLNSGEMVQVRRNQKDASIQGACSTAIVFPSSLFAQARELWCRTFPRE